MLSTCCHKVMPLIFSCDQLSSAEHIHHTRLCQVALTRNGLEATNAPPNSNRPTKPQLPNRLSNFQSPNHPPTHWPTRPPAHPPTRPPAHPPKNSAHPPTHPPTHPDPPRPTHPKLPCRAQTSEVPTARDTRNATHRSDGVLGREIPELQRVQLDQRRSADEVHVHLRAAGLPLPKNHPTSSFQFGDSARMHLMIKWFPRREEPGKV